MKPNEYPIVTAVIVTYNSSKEIIDCLDSCQAEKTKKNIIVIDNNSTDGSVQLVNKYVNNNKNIQLISSETNIGLAAANNLSLPHLRTKYTLILNPDTILQQDTIHNLIQFLESNPHYGIAGPLNLYPNGNKHRSYHSNWTLAHLLAWRMIPYSIIRQLYDQLSMYTDRDVYFVSGSCLIIRTDIFLSLKGYDPAYFLTVEDACDLCLRANKMGFKTRFISTARMTHLCGRSNIQVPYLSTIEGYRGDIYFFGKHHGTVQHKIARLVIYASCLVKIMASLAKVLALRRTVDKVNLKTYFSIISKIKTL